MQFVFMPERGTIDGVHSLRRMLEEYHINEISCMFFVDIEKAFDSAEESVGMADEEEKIHTNNNNRNTRHFGWISD